MNETAAKGNTAKNAIRAKPAFEPRKCAVCGETFTPQRANQMVCSDMCRYRRQRQLSKMRNMAVKKSLGDEARCLICGKTFVKERRNQKCCSDICRGQYLLEYGREYARKRRNGEGMGIGELEALIKRLNERLGAMKGEAPDEQD